ncbi:hypothetical protein DRJ17_04720 [Candidatus Woesearchaeota archaeon]|nr:MAG: hypothetical protein DRJ17_04720 [Candidatus Woesearchaeota archaeon]
MNLKSLLLAGELKKDLLREIKGIDARAKVRGFYSQRELARISQLNKLMRKTHRLMMEEARK